MSQRLAVRKLYANQTINIRQPTKTLRQNETASKRLSNFSQLIKTTMTSWCPKINTTSSSENN